MDLDAVDRDLDLFGVVTDDQGQPVAGASVGTTTMPWRRAGGLYSPPDLGVLVGATTTSAADGSYAIRLRRGECVNLQASAEGHGDAEVANCLAGQRQDVVLFPEARLRVTCVDQEGNGVSNVLLQLWRRDALSTTHRREGMTNEAGAFSFDTLATGLYTVSCIQTDHEAPAWEEVQLIAGRKTEVTIKFPAGREVTGMFTDALTGSPIAGARVGLGWIMRSFVVTDASGRYRIPSFSGVGVNHLHVTTSGYGRSGMEVPESGDLDFVLQCADRVRGRLVSESGQLAAAAFVQMVASQRRDNRQVIDLGALEVRPTESSRSPI
ncbi:MAG: carboxypeptidase regulatory-like domain-containing protein [Planctomycetes bacterium]|nr:carboxypeptidase regulatory-like domain-containing protein [Planctomycetota bacterium]